MAPTLTALDPLSLAQNTVDGQVVISGSGFNQTSTAYFGGTPCQTVCNTSSQVTATVPPAVTSLPGTFMVVVENNDTGEVSNPLSFSVTAAAGFVHRVVAPSAGAGFGIVSSIQFKNTPFYNLFKLGTGRPDLLNDNNIKDNIGYQQNNLYTAINTMNGANGVAILITFGGNITAAAAAQYSQRPYLSVIGNLTPDLYGTGDYTLMGGVNLDTVVRNADRFNYLNQELKIPAS